MELPLCQSVTVAKPDDELLKAFDRLVSMTPDREKLYWRNTDMGGDVYLTRQCEFLPSLVKGMLPSLRCGTTGSYAPNLVHYLPSDAVIREIRFGQLNRDALTIAGSTMAADSEIDVVASLADGSLFVLFGDSNGVMCPSKHGESGQVFTDCWGLDPKWAR